MGDNMENFKIMVVEDEAVIAMGLQMRLESWGYIVEPVVSSGEKAVDESFRIKPDLIIMDIGVKGKFNGIEAARRIRGLKIPVIYITGQDDEELMRKAAKTVPYALLKKPVDHAILKHKIRSAMEDHQLRRKNW
jgi:two-component system, response regulator PdtaR